MATHGLQRFYDLRDARLTPPPENVPSGRFAHWDEPEFLNHFARDGSLDLYLEGVHCSACVWLVERLPQLDPGVASATLDLTRGVARLRLTPSGKYGRAAAMLERLGLKPHATSGTELEELQKRERRAWLARIGVAAACTMNLMMLSIALYAGLEGPLAEAFEWASLVLFTPVLFYSAQPFYKSAWAALRARRLSIDLPIVLGISLGAAAGVFNLLSANATKDLYFDSLAMLILLVLGSRYLTLQAQVSAARKCSLTRQMLPSVLRRREAAGPNLVALDAVRIDDVIEVRSGEMIPVDGVIVDGRTELDGSILTGEPATRPVHAGDCVAAGDVNVVSPIWIRVTRSGAESRLGEISALVQEAASRRMHLAAVADRISGWFIAIVLVVGAATFAYWSQIDLMRAFNNTMALFVITCPCALAMSGPVASFVSLGRLARRGIVVKGPDVLERLSMANAVVLDKTGTVTEGLPSVVRWDFVDPSERSAIEAAVLALEHLSAHPIARALVEACKGSGTPGEVSHFEERLGTGVSGFVQGRFYELRRAGRRGLAVIPEGAHTGVAVFRDGIKVAVAWLGDRIRLDSAASIDTLKATGLGVYLLSGDEPSPAQVVAQTVGIRPDHVWAACSPARKVDVIERLPRAVMVGDGANDAAALSRAWVGVAVSGGMELSLKAADVYLTKPGVAPLLTLFRGARETVQVIRRNFAFAAVYNLVGATACVTGLITPLGAAILMPISSLTILSSSLLGARSLR